MVVTYEPSLQCAIRNAIVLALADLQCPVALSVERSVLGFKPVILTEDQQNSRGPKSVLAYPVTEHWQPSSSCSFVARPARQQWTAVVVFDRNVFVDRALQNLMREPISALAGTDSVVLRLIAVDHSYRPDVDSEQGTAIKLTFETLSHR